MALSRSLESCANADKRANTGESAAACSSVKERLLWRMVGLIIAFAAVFGPCWQIVKSRDCGLQTSPCGLTFAVKALSDSKII